MFRLSVPVADCATRGADTVKWTRGANAMAALKQSPGAASALLAVTGCLALAVGLLVYMADRNAAHAVLLPRVAALGTGPVFGVIGAWLPSFVHPFAFSLFTAALLPSRSAWRYGACAAWCGVNVAFELGQHPVFKAPLADALQDAFGQTPLTRALASYFLRGTFDTGDLVAAGLGAVAAAGLLYLLQCSPEDDHAH
jgi:hypothetical protein